MRKRINWYTRTIHLMVALAFLLGLAIVPGVVTAQVAPSLVPSIDFNIKGAIHKVCIDWGSYDSSSYLTDWWLVPGAEFNLDDVVVIEPSGPNPHEGGVPYSQTVKDKGFMDNVECIELQAMKVGDIHIYVDILVPGTGQSILAQPLHAEKKWGELDHTELDVNPNKSGVQHTEIDTETVEFPAGYSGNYTEKITDWVYAWHPEWGVQLVDDAVVHWWLVEDTDANQDWVDDLMDYLAAHEGALDDNHWAAHGKYQTSDLGGKQPWEYINDWVCGPDNTAGTADDRAVDPNLFSWTAVDVPGGINTAPNTLNWYAWSLTDNGKATATLSVDVDKLDACTTYKVMIVVLVSYPAGTNPQDDPHNGEQPVCLEKGKKWFHKEPIPQIDQVKTPQLRWAGEKIVLEKDWGYEPYFDEYTIDLGGGMLFHYIDLAFYAAIYSLEEGSIGNLEPVTDAAGLTVVTPNVNDIVIDLEYLGLPAGAQQVICPLGGYYYDLTDLGEDWGGYSDTQCILSTEQSGQADVNAALYKVEVQIIIGEGEAAPMGMAMEVQMNGPIMNHGFLVYFLEFEDVTLAEDITPLDSLTGLVPDTEDAQVAVQVRGFFDYRYSHLMATMREAKAIDLNDDGVVDKWLPEGRYVLPDDWWLIAETTNIALRPNYDLMDQAHLDTIVSPLDTNLDHDEELGPYDVEVRTTEPPGEAEYPTIGPFSTYQLWSTEDMWVAAATVPSSLSPDYLRNTVVPDGEINWYDAPMPQALVIFDVVSTEGALYGLDKGNLEGYGFEWSGGDKVYQSPYYAVEIPANWQIPPGYNWMSWRRDPSWMYWYIIEQGPYDFWTDLQLKSIISNTTENPIDRSDVEVYSDNHGIAAVTVGALDNMGSVTIKATAEYPYTPKRGKYGPRVSDEIDIYWGPKIEHLNPDFEADPREGDAPLYVEFDPSWTTGGTIPYVKAEWDINGDGVIEHTDTGSWNTPGAIPTYSWTYTADGEYTVRLTITDSTPAPIGPLVHTEEKVGYVKVGTATCDPTPSPEDGFADLIAGGKLVIVYNLDPFTTVPTAVDGWTWYDPALPDDQNNLDTLLMYTAYWVKVTEDCSFTYGTNTYPLATGWNNPVWLGC